MTIAAIEYAPPCYTFLDRSGPAHKSTGGPIVQFARQRILVVDDQAEIREFVTCSLREAGYFAVAASCGHEMRAAFETGRFDLVILDAILPDERGLDLASFVIGRGIRILMITGDRFNMNGVVGLANPILQKPFRGAKLLEAVRTCLAAPARPRYSPEIGAHPAGPRSPFST